MTTMKRVTINDKWEIVLPLHRAERPEWFTEKGWEKKRLEKMHKEINKDDVVLYIGSEEGEMPALCQMWGAKVFLFEPNEKVWPNTYAIWKSNHLEDPLGCFVGFASNKTDLKETTIVFNDYPLCVYGDIISDHGFKELAFEGDSIPQLKIDDLCLRKSIIPTIISLDVEGSEWEVLRGAESILRMFHPKIFLSLHPEFMFRMFNEYSYDLRNWIKDLGYTETLLDYEHEVHLYYEKI